MPLLVLVCFFYLHFVGVSAGKLYEKKLSQVQV